MSASSPAPAAVRIAVPAGTTGAEAVEAAKLPTHGPHAIVVVRAPDGTLKDLDWRPDSDVEVEAVAIDSPDGLDVLDVVVAVKVASSPLTVTSPTSYSMASPEHSVK